MRIVRDFEKHNCPRYSTEYTIARAFNFEKDINSLYNSDTIKYYLIRNINLVLIATWILYAHSSRE